MNENNKQRDPGREEPCEPRLVVVGDTHCRFDRLEQMIARQRQRGPVPAVLHCGDLGLYDRGSMGRLPARERNLILKHRNPVELCYPYLDGAQALPVPLWGVPGNHEDFQVVEELEGRRRRLPGLNLLIPGQRVALELGQARLVVMGLGRILPIDAAPRSRRRPRYIRDDALARAAEGPAPDILLLHEPPRLRSGRGAFGSPQVSRLVRTLRPRLVICGHMHFEYRAELDGIPVVGLGYGVAGRHAVVDRQLEVRFEDLQGRPAFPREVSEEAPPEPPSGAAEEKRRARKQQNRLQRTPLPLTGRDVIGHFELGRLRKGGKRKVDRLMGELRRHLVEHGTLTREQALVQAEAFLRDNHLLGS